MMVYLCGPVNKDPLALSRDKVRFGKAKAEVESVYPDYEVVNPTEIQLPVQATESHYEDVCLDWLNRCGMLILLPGWDTAKNSLIEYGFALAKSMFIIHLGELEEGK